MCNSRFFTMYITNSFRSLSILPQQQKNQQFCASFYVNFCVLFRWGINLRFYVAHSYVHIFRLQIIYTFVPSSFVHCPMRRCPNARDGITLPLKTSINSAEFIESHRNLSFNFVSYLALKSQSPAGDIVENISQLMSQKESQRLASVCLYA